MRLLKSKKGTIDTYMAVIVTLFATSLSYIVAYLILLKFRAGFVGDYCTVGSVCELTANKFLNSLAMYDYIIVIVMVVLFIGVGLTSYRLSADVAFGILSVLLAPFLGFLSLMFNHIYSQIVSNSQFISVIGLFPRTTLICTNLHWVALVSFIIGFVTLYGKRRQGQFITQ